MRFDLQVEPERRVLAWNLAVAILLEALLTALATAAAVDEASDAHTITDGELGHGGAHRFHDADNLVARHHRIDGPDRPLGTTLVHIRMANAVEVDIDEDVVRPRRPPQDLVLLEFAARVMACQSPDRDCGLSHLAGLWYGAGLAPSDAQPQDKEKPACEGCAERNLGQALQHSRWL